MTTTAATATLMVVAVVVVVVVTATVETVKLTSISASGDVELVRIRKGIVVSIELASAKDIQRVVVLSNKCGRRRIGKRIGNIFSPCQTMRSRHHLHRRHHDTAAIVATKQHQHQQR